MTTTPPPHVLVAEDDDALRALLADILGDGGYRVTAVRDGRAALDALAAERFDAVVSDVAMPGADGLEVVAAARRLDAPPPVVLLTAFSSVKGAVEAMRLGAFDYVSKPLESPQALRALVRRALDHARAGAAGAAGAEGDDSFVCVDPRSLRLAELIALVAARDTSVLLLGESGVGKEVIARRIHALSARRDGPFLAVNCGAIPMELFESQLFGHARGAFTGANAARAGTFEEATGGTLLLDEIGDLPLAAQVKLLRVLEVRAVTRLGEARPRPVDVRVIAATHRDLPREVASGRFREDLYYRLSVFPLEVAALRERPLDIVPLAFSCLRRAGDRDAVVTEAARRALERHPWPGNVRELRNVMERASILARGGPIGPEHLLLGPLTAPLQAERPPARAPAAAAVAPGDDGASLKDLEKQAILDALAATGGNRKAAAERLGIALRTLQYKLKSYGLIQR